MKALRDKFNKNTLRIIGIVLLVAFALLFVYTGRMYGNQSKSAMYPKVAFSGQVKVGDGEWMDYKKGGHIPANKGDVVLKGVFELLSPNDGSVIGQLPADTHIALYLNHIGGEITEDGREVHYLDTELGVAGEDMCGKMYIGYKYKGGEQITITLKNPHKFGNEKAIDEMLENLSTYGGTYFENDMQNRGIGKRTLGITIMLCAFVILGIAIFTVLIHARGSRNLWFVGLAVFFAGVYFIFSAHGVMFWSEIVKFNTRTLGISMMLYMFFVTALIAVSLRKAARKTGKIMLVISGAAIGLTLVVSALTDIKFYDTWGMWALCQGVVCVIMTGLLIHEFVKSEKNEEILYAFGMLPMIAFIIDVIGTAFAWWQGGMLSGIVFVVLFLVAVVMLLRIIPKNINAAMKAKELEAESQVLKAELVESRIATLISQIQPHFIYNTLGTIEQLCLTEPEAASKLVHNFSLYLRGNFSELDKARPIRFSQEMNHVKCYTDIEQVRFPDMTIQYDLRSVEFVLPALSVQPLVENAIKHGLMGLDEGGIVTISAFETDSHYIVEVTDDGVGFDSEAGYDEKKHVGIKNIRGRIEAMCNGSLTVESKIGQGTKATIRIPKEAGEIDSNNS